MKEQLQQLSAYHVWANQLLLDLVNNLGEEKQHREVASSFNSLYKTVLHMLDAESIWWQRMKLQEHIRIPSQEFSGTMKELSAALLQVNRQWVDWISHASENLIQHQFKYQNSKRESFKQPIGQMLLHVFNHGSYHRGQLVTMLRQLGVEKIPQTDFIVWSRKR
ncbi:MAG TPA: DinB family protein [Flavisolibacter sp.]